MVFPRFVTETTPMERDRDVRDGPSNWPGGQAGPVKFGRPKTPFWNWWNNWKSSQKGGPVEFKGGGKATGGAKRASRCWRCWFESQALWLQVVRVKEFWMPLGRLVLGVVPILGPKMGSIFCEDSMPRVCKSVASYLCLFLPCIRFFLIFLPISGECKQVLTRRYQSGMTVGPAKCIFCFQIARGVHWLITPPPPLNSWQKNRFNSGPLTCARWRFNIGGCRNLAAPGKTWCVREMCGIHFLELLYDRTHNILYQYQENLMMPYHPCTGIFTYIKTIKINNFCR